jgi:hypothetical protein
MLVEFFFEPFGDIGLEFVFTHQRSPIPYREPWLDLLLFRAAPSIILMNNSLPLDTPPPWLLPRY